MFGFCLFVCFWCGGCGCGDGGCNGGWLVVDDG